MSTVVTSDKKEIGQLSQISYFEWTVEDILSHGLVDCRFESPRFTFQNSQWYLCVYPNGETEHNSAGWIGLYLMREDDTEALKRVTFSLGIGMKAGRSVLEQVVKDHSTIFHTNKACGTPQYLKRSELQRRRSELVPFGALTMTCSFIANDIPVKNSRLDTLSEDFIDLFNSKKDCDTVLKVQHKEFPVHKLILSTRSTVFEAMFDVDMKEKVTGSVDIEDCDPEAFKDFLTYLYSGRFEINSDNVFELYRIAHKYDVEELESACILHMMSRLSVENVCETAILAEEFVERGLKHKIQVFFNDNFGEIISTAAWIPFLKENTLFANKLISAMAYDKKL